MFHFQLFIKYTFHKFLAILGILLWNIEIRAISTLIYYYSTCEMVPSIFNDIITHWSLSHCRVVFEVVHKHLRIPSKCDGKWYNKSSFVLIIDVIEIPRYFWILWMVGNLSYFLHIFFLNSLLQQVTWTCFNSEYLYLILFFLSF